MTFVNIKTKEQIEQEQAQKEADARIAVLKKNLADTDYKVLPDYDKKEDLPQIEAERQAWRDEIRALQETL